MSRFFRFYADLPIGIFDWDVPQKFIAFAFPDEICPIPIGIAGRSPEHTYRQVIESLIDDHGFLSRLPSLGEQN